MVASGNPFHSTFDGARVELARTATLPQSLQWAIMHMCAEAHGADFPSYSRTCQTTGCTPWLISAMSRQATV